MPWLNLYATLVSLIATYYWLTAIDGAAAHRAGKVFSAIIMFLVVCLFADKFARGQYADTLLKVFCCLMLTVLMLVVINQV